MKEKQEAHGLKFRLLQTDYQSKQTLLQSLVPVAEQFAQYVYQMIEHSLTNPLEKVMLGLPLADLEAAVQRFHANSLNEARKK